MIKFKIMQYILLALTFIATIAGANLTFKHMKVGEVCPMLGPVPACAVVFVSYLLMFISALIITKPKAKLFYLGWMPIFLLALSGVIVEFTGTHICPPGALGIPQCFYSLGIAILCLLLFILARRGLSLTHRKQA